MSSPYLYHLELSWFLSWATGNQGTTTESARRFWKKSENVEVRIELHFLTLIFLYSLTKTFHFKVRKISWDQVNSTQVYRRKFTQWTCQNLDKFAKCRKEHIVHFALRARHFQWMQLYFRLELINNNKFRQKNFSISVMLKTYWWIGL